jgi:hypothetical protein
MSVAAMSTAIHSIQTIWHGEGGVLAHEGEGGGAGRFSKTAFISGLALGPNLARSGSLKSSLNVRPARIISRGTSTRLSPASLRSQRPRSGTSQSCRRPHPMLKRRQAYVP